MKASRYQVLALGLVLFARPALAQVGFQFAAPNLQAPQGQEVSGVRLSFLHGKNQAQRGLDLGLLSVSETSNLSGLALVLGVSRVTRGSDAAAFSLINWHSGKDSGVNGAFINLLADSEGGFNTGFVIIAEGPTGVDLGGFNMSRRSTAQIGFLNVTDEIKSVQFGFLNIAKNGVFPILPVVNFPKN